jgi:hypothetical protein
MVSLLLEVIERRNSTKTLLSIRGYRNPSLESLAVIAIIVKYEFV